MFLTALKEALIIKKEELAHIKNERDKLGKQNLIQAITYHNISRLTAMSKMLEEIKDQMDHRALKGHTYFHYSHDLLAKSPNYRKEICKILKSYGYKTSLRFSSGNGDFAYLQVSW